MTIYYLPVILKEFQRRYPKARLDVNSWAFHTLKNELRIGIVDMAFLLAESIQTVGLHAEVLDYERLVFVAGPMHPLGI